MTLDQFEVLVLGQQPASVAWEPVTDYSFDTRKAVEGEHPQRIKDVFKPAMVIDAGCGPDAVLVRLLTAIDVEVLGFDPQLPRRAINPRLMQGSILDRRLMGDTDKAFADLVVCREVLEHLTVREIRTAVTNLCKLTTRYVYVTTRFAPRRAPLCENEVDFYSDHRLLDVATSDDLDPTHISMLNQDLLRVLFVLEGFKRRADFETAMDWQQKGRVLVYERAA